MRNPVAEPKHKNRNDPVRKAIMLATTGGLLYSGVEVLVQAGVGAMLVTTGELLVGLLVNRWLGWNVWDYSDMWGNVLGQICPKYTALWGLLSLVGIVLDDWLRHWFWGEKRPQYKLI